MSENRINEQLKQEKDAIGEVSPSQEAKEKSLRAMKNEIHAQDNILQSMAKKKRRNQMLTGFTATVAAAAIGGLVLISSDDMAGWFNPAGTVDDGDHNENEEEAPEPLDTNENEEEEEDERDEEDVETEEEQPSDVTADTFNDRTQRFYNIDLRAVDADDQEDVIEEQSMRLLYEDGMPYSVYIPADWTLTTAEGQSYTRYEMADDHGTVFHLLQFETGDEAAARSELNRQLDDRDAEAVSEDEQWLQDFHWTMEMGDEPVEQYRAEDGDRVHNWSFVNPEGYPDTPVILHSVETVENDDQIERAGYFHSSFQRVYPTVIDESDETGMNDRALEAEILSMSDHGPGTRETVLNEAADLGVSFYYRERFSDSETGDRGQRMIRNESENDLSFVELGRFDTVDEALAYQQDWRETGNGLPEQGEEPEMHLGNRYSGDWLVNRDVLGISGEVREELETEGGLSAFNDEEMFFVFERNGYGYYMMTGGDIYFSEYIDLILHTWQWEDGTMLLDE
ncbi:hypothetical protein [Salisediminibacterium selenitireducens]|uniref:Uncharacterized protein n=1 Tax=Bacillus selenitireducens (strain ATCC 700615 / DSM 15326 / MLS10) TaxID=439292 RepID=D6XV88_BACIE|nr:hypothetical protein [Salisediminibacterium selenitireducens]ADH97646.1 hypothetical protein Bsel_0097 [[Bacillus] selenitireducens MLS10]